MIYIGIDTGTDTGLAVWDTRAQRLTDVRTLKIHQAMEMVLDIVEGVGGNALVVFEDARQRKWIPAEGTLSKWKGRAMGAGSIKRDASIWEDFLLDKRIPFEMVPPRAGLTKWNKAYWERITGYKGRTSEHGRDAALLVFGR
jgi:hypothetical protein